MKSFTFATLFLIAFAFTLAEDKYTSKYDNFDVDSVLNNDRILTNYIKCLLGEGPCTNEGRELKKVLPDALSTGCNKCNDKQKSVSRKVLVHLIEKKPAEYKKLAKKFDPDGKFEEKYKADILNATEKPKA
uniref:Chemosensory protein n=1 Tax=Phenacoccus solenopsis TaxID=483260 RepID=A0A0C5K7Z6_9HEMI|nr:chemosensory protein [Phenacoccus solenopsis]